MDWITITVLFVILFLFSLLWRYWLNDLLETKPALNIGLNESEPTFEADTIKYNEYMKKKLGNQNNSLVEPTSIKRNVKISFKHSIYVNKTFSLIIRLTKNDILVYEDEKEIYQIKTDKLNFEAYEKEPKVTVELKYVEGDFEINQKKRIQKLNESKDTIFNFMVKPLKAEDCILTVVFSYKEKIPMSGKITEKVITKKSITPKKGNETTEYSEQTTIVPVEKDIEIKAIDLPISVKSFLRLNAKQLDILKKSIFGMTGLVFFTFQVLVGELEGFDALIGSVSLLATIFGVAGFDALEDRLSGKKDDSDDST
ncbi:hypothetical protein AC477_01230 [miscellaneous Crenarchaeota group-1 archaeon SG8-32-1]|uniref:Uncharacterized protein n=1 Tax=miscellaneous Crenarchaeota group-1 archaeon SG8-32-1 TaxID=1685124 RepID=A0A0M0BZD5_9ARCH|nr:MAG: hypothetical protein AC477_01230 [miscellaneous Crenarchaeota group-1 archaeon SG8-32-1]